MDYKKIYNDLIESRLKLNHSKKEKDCFYEKHHIIPKCLGGSNTKINLILLTPREYYIAHLLLTQMYEGKEKAKICYALIMMCCVNNSQKRIVSSKQYELAKKLVSENCKGENAHFYGKKWSEIRKNIPQQKIECSYCNKIGELQCIDGILKIVNLNKFYYLCFQIKLKNYGRKRKL
jgi:hypothetical protein